MKKVFMILATLAVASMTLVGCKKDDNKGGKDEPKDPDQPKEEVFEVAIDGNFSDWDALTADKATEYDACVFLESGAEAKNLKALKATSDEEVIYIYAEIAVDKVQSSDKAIEGGNSWDGHGDATPGPLTLYIDCDGDPTTGFTTHCDADGEPLIPGIGCEIGAESYLFIDSKDGKCKLGWSQMIYEPDGASDGQEYQCNVWWNELTNPVGGWDDTQAHDNICPRIENYATAVGGGVVKIEMGLEKSVLAENCKRGHDLGDKVIIGANFFNNDSGASYVKGAGLLGPITIKLR